MTTCTVCWNLQPETLRTAPKGQRAILFIDIGDLIASVSNTSKSSCKECQVIWKALCHAKSEFYKGIRPSYSVELVIAFGKPLRINWHEHSLQLELFSNYQDAHNLNGAINDDTKEADVFGPASHVSAHSGAEKCFALASAWLQKCLQTHSMCSPSGSSPLPTRLLYVGSGSATQDLYLAITNGQQGRYVALSYCWGSPQSQLLKTTASNLEAHKSQIKFSSLSRTLQHAVIITRRLGIEYLWVDALCIIQGDPDDWARESAKTAQTYLNAVLTVSADNSSGCDKGIFNEQIYGVAETKIPYKDGRFISVRKAFAQEHDKYSLSLRAVKDPEPITCRAWTLQESMLSNRLLRYTSNELVWTCNEVWQCECGSARGSVIDDEDDNRILRVESGFETLPLSAVHDQWQQLVMQFSERDATEESDKLPALSGLAAQFATILQRASASSVKDSYLAGLWLSNLPKSLLWCVENDFYRSSRTVQLTYQRSRNWRAPSWSWACMDGSITYDPISNFVPCVKILEASTTPKTIDRYGQVGSGRLVVKSRFVQDLPLHIFDPAPGRSSVSFTQGRRYALQVGTEFRTFTVDDPDDFAGSQPGSTNVKLSCLLIGLATARGILSDREEIFLVLKQRSPMAAAHNYARSVEWQRVGRSVRFYHDYVSVPMGPMSSADALKTFEVVRLFDSASEETVTIL